MKKIQNVRFRCKTGAAAGVALAMTVMIATGDSMALLQAKTQTLENHFVYGLVNVVPEETFTPTDISNGKVVKQLRIKNSRTNAKGEGNLNIVPAYVRVQLVASWVKEEAGEEQPVLVPFDPTPYLQYDLNLNSENKSTQAKEHEVEGDWVIGDDGYYYFTKAIDPDQYTDDLLEGVALKEGATLPVIAKEGYLQLDVLVDAVQAKDPDAVNTAWNFPTSGEKNIY